MEDRERIGFFLTELTEFSRIGSGFAGEFHLRYYPCSSEESVVQMISAWTSEPDWFGFFDRIIDDRMMEKWIGALRRRGVEVKET
jgi:hypothetical protein